MPRTKQATHQRLPAPTSTCPPQDGQRLGLGSCMELVALPGEDAPRIVQALALWAEGAEGGSQGGRMFARVRRFYRPEVCGGAAGG